MVAPAGYAGAKTIGQLLQKLSEFGWRGDWCAGSATGFAVGLASAKEGVKLLCHDLAVAIQLSQEWSRPGVPHGQCHPGQVVILGRQHMGLSVVQVLNAVFNLAQKHVGGRQRIGRGRGHQPGPRQARQCIQRGARTQLRELAASHDLK